jgi:hypothetical protein
MPHHSIAHLARTRARQEQLEMRCLLCLQKGVVTRMLRRMR